MAEQRQQSLLLVVAASLVPLTRAQSCSAGAYEWCARPYYYSTLPGVDASTCCGSQLVVNPSFANNSGFACECDLTAGMCDPGCCCDTDCTAESRRFGGVFGCTTNGTAGPQTAYTVCSNNLVSFNPRGSAQEQGIVTAFGGADGLLCVVADNSPGRGSFYRDPVASTALTAQQILTQIDGILPIQYGTTWLAPASSIPPVTYTIDVPLLGDGCLSGASATGCARLSPVLLPAPDADGSCTGSQALAYLRDLPPFSCSLTPLGAPASSVSLAALCATTLNASFVNRATFASAPLTTAPAATKEIRLLTNGSLTGDYLVATSAPSSVYDAASGTCNNALTRFELNLLVNGYGSLSTATAYLKLESVSAAMLPNLRTSYAAAFTYPGEQNADVRATSGRPGYVRGLPLNLAEGQNLRTGGLKLLPRTPTGACSSGHMGATPVLFGEDLAVSCTTRLSASDLAARCSAQTPLLSQDVYAALNLTQGVSVIGAYGDSHPSLPDDWVPLRQRFPQGDAANLVTSWDAAKQACSNVLSGMHLRVLYAEIGPTSAPYAKVVGAELVLTSRTVSAARAALGGAAATSITTTASVTFAKLNTQSFEFVPDTPQIVPQLPYDFFYPFTQSFAV